MRFRVALTRKQENEADTAAFDGLFEGLDCTVIRYDAADVAVQVDEARAAEAELQRQAKAAVKAQKKADRQQKAAEHRASLKAGFEDLKAKFK